MNLRIRIGELLLRTASVVAAVGRKVQGRPERVLSVAAEQNAKVIHLSRGVPGFVRGLRLVGSGSDEIRMVKSVSGDSVELDVPLADAFPRGTKVKVLV